MTNTMMLRAAWVALALAAVGVVGLVGLVGRTPGGVA